MAAFARLAFARQARPFSTSSSRAFLAQGNGAVSSPRPGILSVASRGSRSSERYAFHTSMKNQILPPLPQRVDGTANDPVSLPDPSPTHGSYHWTFERVISAALIPLTIAPFAAGSLNPIVDAVLCGAIVVHSHIGFQSVIIDYIPTKRMPKIRALFWWGLRAGTLLVAVGLYEFETNDVGVTEAIKKIWTA